MPLGPCPLCGINRDIPGIGLAHRCRAVRKLPPMVHPEGEPIVGATIDAGMWDGPVVATPEMMRGAAENMAMNMARIEASNKSRVPELQKKVDEVKRRGRPATRTPEERKAYRAELMRKRRAEKKGAGK